MARLFRLFFLALTLAVGAIACCQPQPRQGLFVATFHADVDFRPVERRWLDEAARRLEEQTQGLVRVSISYDYNTNRDQAFDEVIVRLTSDSPLAEAWAGDHPGLVLLGLTARSRVSDEVAVYFMADSMVGRGPGQFISTAMHEFLHAAGLAHVADKAALMAATDYPDAPPTLCLHKADVVELCRVYGCVVERIGYC